MEGQPQGSINFLSVGTKILLKDAMDQYLRTLGDFRTHYASNMASALRTYSESTIHIIICEVNLEDGSAYRMVKSLGDLGISDDLYFILALEEKNEQLLALAEELEVHSIMVKPFAAKELKAQIDKYRAWKEVPKEPWRLLLHEAAMEIRERKYRDAEVHFQEAIACAPTNPIPLYRTGMYYLGKSDYGLAENFLKKALALNSNYTQALAAMGQVYLAKQELALAEEMFRRAQSISPLNPDRSMQIVRMYIDQGMEACKESLRLDPSNAMARLQLGKLLAMQRDYVGAVRELDKVLPSLKPEQRPEAQIFTALARKLGGIAK